MQYEAVIGLEVHAQLSTASKIFCGCRAKLPDGHSVADAAVNSNTCPVCAGHPGSLPVLNRKVVEFAIKAGLATNCRINKYNVFARKNYFYPDLPKGYQISQYDQPICEHGWLLIEIPTPEGPEGGVKEKKITIQRIHLEEDAGKNVHMAGFSLVNLNRSGVPLIEIVSAPELNTPEEAGAYLRTLHAVVTYLNICDGNMQEGNFRCDANVSIKPVGANKLGTRTEIKNVNSFRFVEKAIAFEIARQTEVLSSGGKIVQETRTYDSAKNITLAMRSKEEAHDYRYFPDPDLIPLKIEESWIEEIQKSLPELPEQKRIRFIKDFGLSRYDAWALTASKSLSDFFDQTLAVLLRSHGERSHLAKFTANWLTGDILKLLNEESIEIWQSKLKPDHLAELVQLIQTQVLSSTGAKQALSTAWKTGDSISSIVEREGLKQVSSTSELEPTIAKVIAAFPTQVADFRAGKEKLLGFFVGQVMKETGGKANPALLQTLIKETIRICK